MLFDRLWSKRSKKKNKVSIKMSGLSYLLGAEEGYYSDLPEVESVVEAFNMSGEAEIWGFGHYRKTQESYFEFITNVGQEALRKSQRSPESIDAVFLCSATFPFDFETMNLAIGKLLKDLNLNNALPHVISGTGCAAMISGIVAAKQALQSGEASTILLLTTDIVNRGSIRFYQYATISDAASSLILSSDGEGELELVSTSMATSSNLMLKDDQYVSGQKELYGGASEALFSGTEITPKDVDKVFASNLHLPILRIFSSASGFSQEQVYRDNVTRVGHCYGSDPIINYIDYSKSVQPKTGSTFLLQSSAMGHVGNVLVKAA